MRKEALLMMLSVLAVTVGCRMQEEVEVEKSGSAVSFVARTDALTRTVFGEPDGTRYPTYWSGDETVGISLNYDWAEEVGVKVNEAHTVAEFSYVPEESATSYTFFVVTPASALETPSESRKALRIAVPAVQKPLTGSVDEGAQVFYAKTSTYTEKPASVDVRFNHLTAYGKLTLKNVTGTPVRLTLVSDQALSGSCYVAVEDGAVSTREGAHSLTLDLENLAVTSGNLENIWFACLPANLAGTPLSVLLETAEGNTYKRTIPQLGEGMNFISGRIIRFSVDMASAEQNQTLAAADVLNYDSYGAYISGNPMIYDGATDQLSREYNEDQTVTFSILNPDQDASVEFSGIPEVAAYLDVFTLVVRYMAKDEVTYEASFDVAVVKEEKARLWLSDGTNGFIVKR
jgi:hypothetical protein